MFRKLTLSIIFVCLLAGAAHAQTPQPPRPEHTAPFWNVADWNNRSLSGDPAAVDTDSSLDHDWGAGSPHAKVNADRFSPRWTRYIEVSAGVYRFTATSDDGIRIYVDDDLVIDQWYDQSPQTFTADAELTAGHHLVKVEYYENTGGAVARVSWEPAPASTGWRGEYFDDSRGFDHPPLLVRQDAEIAFNWGYGSPAPGLPSDHFSVQWTRTAHFESGAYRFTATSDDGIRVHVDGQLVVEGWYDHPARTFSGEVSLTEGEHQISVMYYENTGLAVAQVSWEPASAPSDSWRGEYFANRWLNGPPALIRNDRSLGFNWSNVSPATGIPNDNFSVRWTRTFHFEPGSYRFTTTTDDGVRLWVNGHLLIDQWRDQALTAHSGVIYLSGDAPLEMEYYEHAGLASAWLTWERDDVPPPSPGTVIVDDIHSILGFVQSGSRTGWHTESEGYRGHLTWTRNNDRRRPNYNWARWYPSLAAGRYEVFVYIPERYTTTSQARYWVSHRDGYTLRIVDQSANGGRWVSLGVYRFRGSRDDYVSLADVTYEPRLSRLIAFDAVKWVPR
ncbi:MAG: hypothetical protein DRI81_16505 [Chloroflexi bacterium]|nr:MAG: hypothetical protein DRI81_16505 [Chloroflexota bacterium]